MGVATFGGMKQMRLEFFRSFQSVLQVTCAHLCPQADRN